VSDFITLGCPSCGGNLAVTKDADRFACPFCGREHLVRRSGGHVSLVPIVEKLDRIGEGVDRHASELAIQRLREDRRSLKERIKKQQDRVRDWKRARAEDGWEVASKRTKSVVWFVAAVISGCLSVGLFIAGDTLPTCIAAILVPTGAVASLLALIARAGLRTLIKEFEESQAKLNKSRDRLDELNAEFDSVQAELEHHEQVVRRS
jgi:ribosomal protein S27E